MDEINALVTAYNEAEKQQAERLEKIFKLVKNRKGFRYIKFDGANMLTNCWNEPDHLDHERYLHKYLWGIEEIVAGQE